jgi:alpha-glucosidase
MWLMIKDDQFRDNPPNPGYIVGQGSRAQFLPIYDADRPEIHELVAEMRGVLTEFGDRVLIGEIYLPIPRLMDYYGQQLRGADLPFNFQLLQCAWTADELARTIGDYMSALPAGAWPNWVLGNHDKSRIASRIGTQKARAAALLLLSLPGTLTIYNGEELGMQDVPIRPEEVQDPAEKRQPGIGMGRDPERSPIPWDSSPLCGFTSGKPWLPIGDFNRAVNVQSSSNDSASMLSFYQRLLRLRRDQPTLASGQLTEIMATDGLLQFLRSDPDNRLRFLVNLVDEPRQIEIEEGVIVASTNPNREGEIVTATVAVEPSEALLIKATK